MKYKIFDKVNKEYLDLTKYCVNGLGDVMTTKGDVFFNQNDFKVECISTSDEAGNQKFVLEGNIHFGQNLIFVETEQDDKGNPLGTFLNELLETNIKENSEVSIVISVK